MTVFPLKLMSISSKETLYCYPYILFVLKLFLTVLFDQNILKSSVKLKEGMVTL